MASIIGNKHKQFTGDKGTLNSIIGQMEKRQVKIPCILLNTNDPDVKEKYYKFCEEICDIVICTNLSGDDATAFAKSFYRILSSASSVKEALDETSANYDNIALLHQVDKNPYGVSQSKNKNPRNCECDQCIIESKIEKQILKSANAEKVWKESRVMKFSRRQAKELLDAFSDVFPRLKELPTGRLKQNNRYIPRHCLMSEIHKVIGRYLLYLI